MDRVLTEVHIADLHFGAFNPKDQFDILYNEFYLKIKDLNYDIICINGDIFDHKFMANSDAVMYAIQFIELLVNDAALKKASMVILYGTESHDAGQLKLFYQYRDRGDIDLHIVETIQFLYLHEKRILAIPEQYGLSEEVYNSFLFEQGLYDGVIMHGTYKGSIYGANTPTLDSPHAPIFDMSHFIYCKGPIIAGHVHIPGCFDSHMYYCGSPLRYKFGEEQEKGFIILNHNIDTCQYYVHFETIQSYRYDTINMDEYIGRDPKFIIEKVNLLQAQGSNYLRIEFTQPNDELFDLLGSYYRNNSTVSIMKPDTRLEKIVQAQAEQSNKYNDYQYIFDRSLSSDQILTRYINQKKGYQYITVEELKNVLNGFMS